MVNYCSPEHLCTAWIKHTKTYWRLCPTMKYQLDKTDWIRLYLYSGTDWSSPSHMVHFKHEKMNYNIKQTHANTLQEVFRKIFDMGLIMNGPRGPDTYGAWSGVLGWNQQAWSETDTWWLYVATAVWGLWISNACITVALICKNW